MESKMNSKALTNDEQVSCRDLTMQEHTSVNRVKQRRKGKPVTIFKAIDNDKALDFAFDESLSATEQKELMNAHIMEATGAVHRSIGMQFFINLGNAVVSSNASPTEMAAQLNTIAQSMQAFGPEDEYEGQLIAQLVVLHEHAMDWLGRAKRTEKVDFANVYLNGASKLLARHHETLEALLKYRRKGEQRVHVEHVHIHEGGQAIVGNVTSGGVGMKPIIEEGPHAKV